MNAMVLTVKTAICRVATSCVCVTTSLLGASVAHAYRTAAELPSVNSSNPVRWQGKEFAYVLYNKAPPGILFDDYERAVEQALAVWTEVGCSSYSLLYFGPHGSPAQPNDGVNTVEWVQNSWVARGFDPTAPGQTDVLYELDAAGQWSIKEADIYLNGESNAWTLVGDASSSKWSVRATLIHEGGHAAGLAHPCEIAAMANVPECGSSTAFTGIAMNPIYNPSLSALSSDDQAGICAIYPTGLCGTVVCAETEACTPAGCRLLCGSATCEPGQICAAGSCALATDASIPIGTPLGFSCTDSAECERGLNCVSGTCQGGLSKLGDPCAVDGNCQEGVCTRQGFCAAACRQAGDCQTTNASCEQVREGIGACVTPQGNLGSACTTADSCVGGECLAESGVAPVCTRTCDAADPCPGGWECSMVDGKSVCVSPRRQPGCNCALASSQESTRAPWVFSLMTMFVFVLRRGRRWAFRGLR